MSSHTGPSQRWVATLPEALAVPAYPIRKTTLQLAKFFGIGFLVVTAIFGSITLLAWLLARIDAG